MRITIVLLLLAFSSISSKNYSEIKIPRTYIGYKKYFIHKLTLNKNGKYIYNHTAGWHRYYSYGKWQIRDEKLLLIPKKKTGEERVAEVLSQGRWIDISNKLNKIKRNKLIPFKGSWPTLKVE